MKLEQQCSSLELAQRLKALGVKQESYFAWFYNDGMSEWELDRYHDDWPKDVWPAQDIRQYSAFTVAELIALHYEQFGYCDIPSKIGADKVADWLGEHLIINLQQNGDKH